MSSSAQASTRTNDEEPTTVLQLTPINPITKVSLKEGGEGIRPSLTVEDEPVFLGGNGITGIIDPGLSRSVMKIYLKGSRMFLFCQHANDGLRGRVIHNGMLLLPGTRHRVREKDIIGLTTLEDSDTMQYAYRLERREKQQAVQQEQPATAKATAPNNTNTNNNKLPPQVAEETMCAICMEIMVQPTTIVPCGHNFCKPCLAQHPSSHCATCRGPIQQPIPCRSLENLIHIFTSSQCQQLSIYDPADLSSYYERTSKKRSPAKVSKRNARQKTTTRRAGTAQGGMINIL